MIDETHGKTLGMPEDGIVGGKCVGSLHNNGTRFTIQALWTGDKSFEFRPEIFTIHFYDIRIHETVRI
jgi:hypothetical protein